MNKSIKPVLIGISVFAISSLLLTSCYTVKGAFQGAGKDVAVLVGPEGNHHHKANTKHVAKAQNSTKTKQVKTTKPVNQSTTSPQSSTTPQSTTTSQPADTQTKTTY